MDFKTKKVILITLGILLIFIGVLGDIANDMKDFWVGLIFIIPGAFIIRSGIKQKEIISEKNIENEEKNNTIELNNNDIGEKPNQSSFICPNCNSSNINIQIINKSQLVNSHRGCLWWLFIGWWWLFIKWFFFTLPALIFKIFGIGKKKTIINTTHKMAVCQNCGHSWEI